jgi:glycerophosphoryl diester phosphodiesterase
VQKGTLRPPYDLTPIRQQDPAKPLNRTSPAASIPLRDVLIGHRGEPRHWPENSLEGFRAILEAGVRYIETDVQLSADGVPVLCHDPSLLRMTGHDLAVAQTDFAAIRALSAGAPDTFGDSFAGSRIPRLADLIELLAQWPEARGFFEVKQASLRAFGIAAAVDPVLHLLAGAASQCTLISFERAALQHARAHSQLPIGWVLPAWSETSRRLADQTAPEFLFVNRTRLPSPAEPLWPGPWQWVVYTADRAADIRRYLAHGFDLIETNDIRRLILEQTAGG